MNLNTRSKVAIILGVVILLVDLLWIYSSFSIYGGTLAGRGGPYGNFTVSAAANAVHYTNSSVAARGVRGYLGGMDIIYGVVILVADLILLYLEISKPKPSAAKTSAKKK